jgi:hypothetical protein
MTIGAMLETVKDVMRAEGIDRVPSNERIVSALNQAKNIVVEAAYSVDPPMFESRQDYTVSQGDASITLPTGWKKILGFHTTDQGDYEQQIKVLDRRSLEYRGSPAGLYVYREGNKLYFPETGGAIRGFSGRLRYVAAVPDLDSSDLTASYTLLDDDWGDLIWRRALVDLLPASNPGLRKWSQSYDDRLGQIIRLRSVRLDDRPMRIRSAAGHPWL